MKKFMELILSLFAVGIIVTLVPFGAQVVILGLTAIGLVEIVRAFKKKL